MTLEHEIEIHINGTPVDPETIVLRRQAVGGFTPQPALKLPYGHIVFVPLAATAAKEGANELGIKLIESNPEIRNLPAYGGAPETDDGIAVGLVEALFGYKELPRLAKPGSMISGEPVDVGLQHIR